MRTIILLNLVVWFIITPCFAQNDRIENELMDCYYQSFEDKGKAFRALISDYENRLINQRLLADNSGESYRDFLDQIAHENHTAPSTFFTLIPLNMDELILEEAQKCRQMIMKDSTAYNSSKLNRLEKVITEAQESKNIQLSLIAKELLTVLSVRDFKLDFYKVRIFMFLHLMNPDTGLRRQLSDSKENETDYDLSKAITIYLNEKSDIFVYEKKVSIHQLKKRIRQYELKNKSESIIIIKAERETLYKSYVDVQDAIVTTIKSLREEAAIERFNKKLDELTKEQLAEIKNDFPVRFKES